MDYSELHKRMDWAAVLYELDQLRDALAQSRVSNQCLTDESRAVRRRVIEECARIVEVSSPTLYPFEQQRLAAAIRALKDKRP